jgi:hypothetical protein
MRLKHYPPQVRAARDMASSSTCSPRRQVSVWISRMCFASEQSRRRVLPVRRQPSCAVPDQPDTGVLSLSVTTEIFLFPSSVSFGRESFAAAHLPSCISNQRSGQTSFKHIARYLLVGTTLTASSSFDAFSNINPRFLISFSWLCSPNVYTFRVEVQAAVLEVQELQT